MDDQFHDLIHKSHRIAHAIASSTVTRHEAFLTYFAVYQPSVSYVLSLSTFNTQQCHKLSSTPTSLFLQKCGFSSKMKRLVVFASRSSGGLGFRHLYTEQGIQHINKLIQVLRTPGQPKQILITAILWWQVYSGVNYPLLEFPQRRCPHLVGSWLSST